MAHNLNIHAGQAAMMYVGQIPWHGLGARLEKPPMAAEAIQAAKFDWRVSKIKSFRLGLEQSCVNQSHAVVREDSNCVL